MAVKFSLNLGDQKKKRFVKTSAIEDGLNMSGSNGRTVFLVHGLTGTPNEMRFLANYFNKKMGYSVVCPRLANHGQPITILRKSKWQEFYRSVRTAFIEVRESTSGPVFVSGLSMGALLSLMLAAEFPGEAAGVSCLSPTLFYDGWNVPWYSSLLLPLLSIPPLKYFSYFKEEPPYGIKNKALQARVHKYYSRATLKDETGVAEYGYPYFPISLLRQLKLLVKYMIKTLPSITTPVQLIQAKEDDMTSTRNSEFIYSHVNSDLKEMVLLENSYHVITADQERKIVACKMAEFFSRSISAPTAKNPFQMGNNGRTIPECY